MKNYVSPKSEFEPLTVSDVITGSTIFNLLIPIDENNPAKNDELDSVKW